MYIDGLEIDLVPLLQRWNIDDYVETGNELNTFCPFKKHSSGSRKFYINKDSGLWNCKVCGDKRGNLIRLIMLLENVDREEARDFLRGRGNDIDLERFGEHIVDLLYEDIVPVRNEKKLRRQAKLDIEKSEPTYDKYWQDRGFSKRTVRKWGLRVDTRKRSGFPYIIPVTIHGELYRTIRRTRFKGSRMKYYYQKGFQRKDVLFGLDKVEETKASTIVVCEGPLDCISIYQALDENNLLDKYGVVAILGDYLSVNQARLLAQYADEVVLFFDNDEGGEIALKSAIEKLKGVFISVANYGKVRAKDPGELMDYEIVRMVTRSRPLISRKVREIYGS